MSGGRMFFASFDNTQTCKLAKGINKEPITKSVEKYKTDTLIYTSKSLEYLPNVLLCDLAEYLIQMTGLKQKIPSELETVSIESDTGLITKSNNLKWIEKNNERIKY